MKAKILIKQGVVADDITKAMRIVRKTYPQAKYIKYFMEKDYRLTMPEKGEKRTMTIAFVDDVDKIFGGF